MHLFASASVGPAAHLRIAVTRSRCARRADRRTAAAYELR